MIKLEVLNTAFKGKRFAFREGLTVCSGAAATIRAQHEGLEEVHARFYSSDKGKPMVEIGCDKAHLFVNGKDVMRSELRHNDEITVGPLLFKVLDAGRTSSPAIRIDQLMSDLEKNQEDEVHDFASQDLFYLTTKDPALRARINFTIPSKDRFIEQAQAFLARMVKQSEMDEEQVDAFMTCAKELILNAHRHGHKHDETKKILIGYRDTGERLSLSIQDEGTGFDHKTVLDVIVNKDAAQAARERYKAGGFGGLGFKLITKLAPDLKYNEAGNQVTFSVPKKAPG